MKRIGIIDVGTMTIRAVVFELLSDTTFKIIEDIKENIALGEGLRAGEDLDRGNMREASHTIYLYKELCERYETHEVKCFISSTFAESRRVEEFIEDVERNTGIKARLLSEREEVQASFTGALNNLDIDRGLLVDMGGNTTKLVWVEDREIRAWHTLKIGGATLGRMSDLRDALKEPEEEKLKAYIRQHLRDIPWLKELRGLKDTPVIGVGGSMRNLAKIHSWLCEYPLNLLHDYHLKEGDVEEVYDYIRDKNYEEKLKVKGLANSRAHTIAGSLLLTEELLSYCEIESMIISGNGMREGMIYLEYLKFFKERSEVFEGSLEEVLSKFNVSPVEGERTYRVFKKIYDELKCSLTINIRDEKILKTACYLGRVGVNINFYDHPLHSLYMILNSGLRGISHRDLVVAALIVSQQNKFNEYYKDFQDLLGKKDINCIKKLSIILRVSKLLNKNFHVDNDEFKVEINDRKVVLSVKKKNLLDAQISRILMSGERFKELFNRELIVSAV